MIPSLLRGSAGTGVAYTQLPVQVMRVKAVWSRSGRTRSVSVRFVLRRKARITFALKGPGQRCSTAARFRVAGRRGLNEVKLTSVVRGRKLAVGTYRLVPEWPARGKALAVYVSKSGRLVPLRRRAATPHCASRAAAPTTIALDRGSETSAFSAAKLAPSRSTARPSLASFAGAHISAPKKATAFWGEKVASVAAVGEANPSLFRFAWVALSALLVLLIPGLFLGAAWRDLRRD